MLIKQCEQNRALESDEKHLQLKEYIFEFRERLKQINEIAQNIRTLKQNNDTQL